MSVGGLPEREDRKAYVRFKVVPVEDKAASLAAGHYVAKNVEFALITPPYTKDVVEKKVDAWISQLQLDVRSGRYPQAWLDENLKYLDAWRKGQELPPNGTAIRGWSMISPAQQETLIHMSILTVEDLAGVNDEGARRIGMGSLDLKNKAKAWLAQRADKGPLTIEMAAVKAENAQLKASLATMQEQVTALAQQVAQGSLAPVLKTPAPQPTISANDILSEGDTDDDPLG